MTHTPRAHKHLPIIYFVLLICTLFAFVGCNAPQLRRDPAPAPSDLLINQARLEFHGCGYDSQIGTLGCMPGKGTAQAVTEYKGKITIASSGAGCSLRQDIAATPPLTLIPIPEHEDSTHTCAVTVVFYPSYPNSPSTVPTETIFGEVVYFFSSDYPYKGNLTTTTFRPIKITFAGAIRGAFTSREFEQPQTFTGDTLNFQPLHERTDLLLVKVWMADGTIKQYSYTANYYSARAQALTYTATKDDDTTRFEMDKAISVTTIAGKPTFDLTFDLDNTFDGYLRSYTAQGRTLVIRFQKGKILWAR